MQQQLLWLRGVEVIDVQVMKIENKWMTNRIYISFSLFIIRSLDIIFLHVMYVTDNERHLKIGY